MDFNPKNPEGNSNEKLFREINNIIKRMRAELNDTEGKKYFTTERERDEYLKRAGTFFDSFGRKLEELNIYTDLALLIHDLYFAFGLSEAEAKTLMKYLKNESGGKDVYATVALLEILGSKARFFLEKKKTEKTEQKEV